MANVTAGAAYKGLTKVGDYISPQINAGADRLSRQGMQQKQLNADAKVAADKRLDDAYAGINIPELVSSATGNQTRDDVARKLANTATNRAAEYAELARDAAAKGDWKGMNDYKSRMKVIEGDFKNTVNDEATIAEVMKGYQETFDKGLVDDDDWLSFGSAWENYDFEIVLDENDKKIIRAIELDGKGKPVLDENGKPNIMEKKWAEVANQKDRPYERVQLEDKEGKKGLVGDMLTNMGKRKYDTVTGQYITTTQTWDETAEQQFLSTVKGLQSNDRMMYSLLKQASNNSIKVKDNSELPQEEQDKNNKLVEDFLRYQVKGGYGTEESMQVRGRTTDEMASEGAKDRATTERGQDMANERAGDTNQVALKRLALDEWKALNPNKADTPLTKTEQKQAENEALVVKFYDVAKEIGNLGAQADDTVVQQVLDDSGLGFMATTDWQFWFQDNEFDIGSVKDIKNKDAFKIVKGMAKKAGLEMKDTDVRDAINAIQAGGAANEIPAEKAAAKAISAEEAAAKAKELIDKYSKKN